MEQGVAQGETGAETTVNFPDGPTQRRGSLPDNQFIRKRVRILIVGEIVPPIGNGSFTDPPFNGVVPNIQQRTPSLLVSIFDGAAEGAFEQGAVTVTDFVAFPGKPAGVFPDEIGKLPGPVRPGGMVDVVRHLAKGQYRDIIFTGEDAEEGKKGKVIAHIVEQEIAVSRQLIAVM